MSETVAKIKDATAQTASAGMIMQKYCNGIVQQPDITIPASVQPDLPDINGHLAIARVNATNYLNVIQPQIISVVTDVSGYSNQFIAFYNLIDKKIELWKTGSGDAKREAIELITALNGEILIKTQNVGKVQTNLQGFQSLLNTDVGHFTDALIKANIVIGGDQGRIASINKEIGELNKHINKLTGGLVASVLGVIGGVVLIVVGAVASIPTAGVSTGLIVAGSLLVAAGVGGTIGTSIGIAKAHALKSNLVREMGQLNDSLTFLNAFKNTMGTVESSAKDASAQLANMRNAWGFLGQKLTNLGNDLTMATSFSSLPIMTQAWLNTAKEDWGGPNGVLTTCANIEQQMAGVNIITLKDPKGGLGLITQETIERIISGKAA